MKISNLKQIIDAIYANHGNDDNAEFSFDEFMGFLPLDDGAESDLWCEVVNFMSLALKGINDKRRQLKLSTIELGKMVYVPKD